MNSLFSFFQNITEDEILKSIFTGLVSTVIFTMIFYSIRPRICLPKRLYYKITNDKLEQISIKILNRGLFRVNDVEVDMVVIDEDDITETFLFKKPKTFSIKNIFFEKECTYTFVTSNKQNYSDIFTRAQHGEKIRVRVRALHGISNLSKTFERKYSFNKYHSLDYKKGRNLK